ncbi:MAG TPA: MBOAT family O-acyltransferase [Vicinamibacterales bacterium]|nr:MBOAT family O-acyltransferase [Vicinamibacterales bacterium]
MVFNSLQFVWFFLIVYAVYRALPAIAYVRTAHRAQNWLLLIASYYFYAAWDYRFLALLAASTLVDYSCGLLLGRMTDQRRRRIVLWTSIGFNLTMLGFFKYFNFFADNLQSLFAAIGWQLDFVTVRILLPIGISFYTFVTMSYVIDVYRRQIEPTRNLVDFAVFVAYFPHLVAGPILRATALLPQIAKPRHISRDQMRDGLWLIAWGFFQKIFVADNLAPLSSLVFSPDAHLTGVNVLLGTYAFAFQIYGDFAGYSNIARGTSKLMGIELIENFRFPYLVVTPQAFWRNWHISLSTWLRDYLYISLGGNRGSRSKTRRNLLVTMLLGGLWHGAAWTFVLWGLYQAGLLIVYRQFERAIEGLHGVRRFAAWLVMFHLTCYGWLIFRAPSLGKLAGLMRSLVFDFAPTTINVTGLLVPLLLYVTPLLVVHLVEARADDVLVVPRLRTVVRYSIYAATLYLILLFGNFGGSDFIYFQF